MFTRELSSYQTVRGNNHGPFINVPYVAGVSGYHPVVGRPTA